MRTKRTIDALFPRTRRDLLAATFGQPERWWYMTELAAHLKTTPSTLQRELESLAQSGVLRQRRDGKRVYYQAEHNLPFFDELHGIMEKALGIAQALREALARLGDRILIAFIYGSVAGGREHALSDVDLVVIGSAGLADVAPLLRVVERKYKRDVNALTYTPAEFSARAKAGGHFVTSLMRADRTFLKGEADELEKLAGKQASPAPRDEPSGNQRPARTGGTRSA